MRRIPISTGKTQPVAARVHQWGERRTRHYEHNGCGAGGGYGYGLPAVSFSR